MSAEVAEAGELLQGLLGGGREPLQLPDHKIRDVVGVALGEDAIDVPSPGPRDRVEREQPFFASAVTNWIAKNGLPWVLSCTSCAKTGRAPARNGGRRR